MNTPIYVPMTVSADVAEISFGVSVDTVALDFVSPIKIEMALFPDYEGPYEFTPNDEEQILNVENMRTTQNIVINPIPSNYGHISWNGSYLTVS